ncbi:MAG: hypothetical protein AVDCRST_MAG31-894 [uncultured Sphingomonas sp.]|uniref:Uncharacterized protein n=1 Tax=uncultured Sphingomonas sp. TaxID=158754 RepID=A0A6J4T1A7_9SPHN|nr:MAG: hypothetical protein AVDCRST_MAG31-894 [uncultured Sphingomonas sp.]
MGLRSVSKQGVSRDDPLPRNGQWPGRCCARRNRPGRRSLQ